MSNSARSFQLRMILNDPEIVEELKERIGTDNLKKARASGIPKLLLEGALDPSSAGPPIESVNSLAFDPPTRLTSGLAAPEAIILEHGRPSLLIQDGTFEVPESSVWRHELAIRKHLIESSIKSVGRIELLNHFTHDWVGTGWVIAPNTICTNRHVAETFVERSGTTGGGFATNIVGQKISARIDMREEYQRNEALEFVVEKVVYIAEPGHQHPDVAILKVVGDGDLPDPLELSTETVKRDDLVGIIGYPAFDSRNGLDAMQRYFGEIYDVKRFAPGKVQFNDAGTHYFLTDYTSLGGNSGSSVINLDSGKVAGLHFAGRFAEANFAVKSTVLADILRSLSISVGSVSPVERRQFLASETPDADRTYSPEHYEGRDGYREDFLGRDHGLPVPGLGRWKTDVAEVSDAPEEERWVARYRHFSVVQSKSRKLPLIAAVNIDGNQLRRVPRTRDWYLDGRIDLDYQSGNELYRHNDLDRGHMVRRLDPVWGEEAVAREANDDSFHYTNSAPQHEDLNQRDWLDLEDVALDYADSVDAKISVFNGPVFRENDPVYRDVQLPREFWKVISYVNAETGQLVSLGFVLSHTHLVRTLQETALDPGSLRIYQVPIHEIENRTGLDFSQFRNSDVLNSAEESLTGDIEIRSYEDVRLG